MYLKFRRANSAENFTWYREVCPSYRHKIWKWYDESLLCCHRVKICNFAMNKEGPSHYFHLHARAPPTAVPGCVDERIAIVPYQACYGGLEFQIVCYGICVGEMICQKTKCCGVLQWLIVSGYFVISICWKENIVTLINLPLLAAIMRNGFNP